MSDVSEGPGWWLASDGKWYPPDAVPSPPATSPTEEHGPTVIGQPGASAKERAATMRRRADNWDQGGEGEARTAARLEHLPSSYFVLHDLHVPGSTANIDHLVIGPSGAWLIDTKAYSAPLRYGDGTLWRGKYPIRKETEAVERYADAVGEVLHVPVQPVLCFVDQVVPAQGRRLGRVHVVPDHDVARLVASDSGTPIADVDSVGRLARTLRTPTPRAPERAPRQWSAPRTPVRPGRPRPPGPERRTERSGSTRALFRVALGLFVIALLGGLAIALIGTAGRALGELIPTTTTVAPPPLDGPTIDVPTPEIGLGALCRRTGEGWFVGFNWPVGVDAASAPAAYEITSWTEGVTVDPPLWLKQGEEPEPITGLAPNATVSFMVQGILEDGTRFAPTPISQTVPDRPC